MHHVHARITILRIARLAAGLRLDDAARLARITGTALSRAELAQGSISKAEIARLAEVYRMPASSLQGVEPIIVSGVPPCVGP